MKALFQRFCSEEMGGGIVEYSLILALVAIAAVTALTTIGGKVTNSFSNVSNKL